MQRGLTKIILFICLLENGLCAEDLCTKFFAQQLSYFVELNRGTIRNNGFYIERGFERYLNFFPLLRERFSKLDKNGHWVDVGAGKANAMKEFSQRLSAASGGDVTILLGRRPKMTAVHAGDSPLTEQEILDLWRSNGVLYLSNKNFLDVPIEELGGVDIVTDLFGAVSYWDRMDLIIQHGLRSLRSDGVFASFLDVKYTTIIDEKGNDLTLEWFKSIKGVKINELRLRTVKDRGKDLTALFFEFERTDGNIEVPELFLKKLFHDRPPRRTYLWGR